MDTLSVDDIFITVNSRNLFHSRNQIITVFRCRYGEIIQNYEYFLIASYKLCLNQKNYYNTTHKFVYCVVQRYESIQYSKSMLYKMNSALYTLRIMKNEHDLRPTSVEIYLTSLIDFIDELANKYSSRVMFFDLNGNPIENSAIEFTNDIVDFHMSVMNKCSKNVKNYNNRYCIISRKPLDCDSLIETLLNLNDNKSESPLDKEIIHLFTEMDTYFETVITQDIENIGF